MTTLRKISEALATVERILCGVLIVAFALLLMVNVVARYLFDSPLFFAEELALLILVWMGYLAIAYSVSREKQIGLGLFVDRLSGQSRRFVLTLIDAIMLIVSAILLWAALDWLQSSSVAFERSVALDIPKWPFYLVIPIFWGLLIVHLTEQLLRKLFGPSE